ncbi:glycosyltransferase family protein [Vibrio taketomensis]|uniref:glycosyltransferase family 1 protein n=1 Tax=Vibrio taketomensis TaxID=2572923 RepID=UPI00138A4DAA|nr:glycosyltransferase family 1 protein [Vibrio taketomensis]
MEDVMRDIIVLNNLSDSFAVNSKEMLKSMPNSGKIVWVDLEFESAKSQKHHTTNAVSESSRSNADITITIKNIPEISCHETMHSSLSYILASLNPLLTRHDIKHPIIWAADTSFADLTEHIKGSSLVYYCHEEYSSNFIANNHFKFELEKTMLKRANLIFGSSSLICSRFPRSKTLILPPAVDTNLFCARHSIAEDMPTNGRPTAGFCGVIDNTVDLQLLYYTALNLPNWNFVYIGRMSIGHHALFDLENVFYLGTKTTKQLPRYIQHWEVSLLPFKSQQSHPTAFNSTLLKYLAAGSPVVSTFSEPSDNYRDYVNVVETAHEMSYALKLSAYENKIPSDIIWSDSWQTRGRYISNLLRSL